MTNTNAPLTQEELDRFQSTPPEELTREELEKALNVFRDNFKQLSEIATAHRDAAQKWKNRAQTLAGWFGEDAE